MNAGFISRVMQDVHEEIIIIHKTICENLNISLFVLSGPFWYMTHLVLQLGQSSHFVDSISHPTTSANRIWFDIKQSHYYFPISNTIFSFCPHTPAFPPSLNNMELLQSHIAYITKIVTWLCGWGFLADAFRNFLLNGGSVL